MALTQTRAHSAGAYPGPSREELADLAEWVTESDISKLPAAPGAIRAPTPIPQPKPVRHRVPKPYAGPTPEELGDLAVWLDVKDTHPTPRSQDSPPPASSLRAIEAELWVADMERSRPTSTKEPEFTPVPAPEASSTDPFLDQLDEIGVALRKRPAGIPYTA